MNDLVSSTAYTTRADFCRIFAEEMNGFYLLALLLTADSEKAERCVVAGLGDCVKGNAVFKEWAQSWARRTIILHAIQIMAPAQGKLVARQTSMPDLEKPEVARELRTVVKLDALERFVFVMSVLEGYSVQDCSILLGCPRQAVVEARQRALEHVAIASESSIVGEESHVAAASFVH
jgi:hypothetical protein